MKKIGIVSLLYFVLMYCENSIFTDNGIIPDIVVWLNIFVYFIIVINILDNKYESKIIILFVLCFVIHVAILIITNYCNNYINLPNTNTDCYTYQSIAVQLINNEAGIRFNVYSYFLANAYKIIGINILYGQCINVMLHIYASIVLIESCRLLNIKKQNIYRLSVIFLFLPNFIIISSVTLREMPIVLFVMLSLYFFICWWKKNKNVDFLLSLMCVIIATLLHSGVIVIIIIYSFCYIFLNVKRTTIKINFKTFFSMIVVVCLVLVFYYFLSDMLFSKFSNVNDVEELVSNASKFRGSSGYKAGFSIGNPILNFVINTPIKTFYFLFSPLPWNWRGLLDIITFVFDSSIYGYILYNSFKEYKKEKNIFILFMIITIICLGIVFGWGVSNSGTALRHRIKMLPFFVILYGFIKHKYILKYR